MPQQSILSFSKNLVSSRFNDGIRIYRLDQGYKHLLTVTLANPRLHVLSSDGSVLVVYVEGGLRVFRIDYETMTVETVKNEVFEMEEVSSLAIDGDTLVLGKVGKVGLLDLTTFTIEVIDLGTKPAMVNRLAVSNRIVVCGDILGNLVSVEMESKTLGPAMPKYKATSIQFMPDSTDLVITTTSNEIYILNVTTNSLHPWSERNSSNIPKRLLNRKEVIKGVTFSATGMLIYASFFVYHVDLGKDIDETWKLDSRYQSIMDVRIQDDQMVVVERPVLQVLSEIGGAVETKKYGN